MGLSRSSNCEQECRPRWGSKRGSEEGTQLLLGSRRGAALKKRDVQGLISQKFFNLLPKRSLRIDTAPLLCPSLATSFSTLLQLLLSRLTSASRRLCSAGGPGHLLPHSTGQSQLLLSLRSQLSRSTSGLSLTNTPYSRCHKDEGAHDPAPGPLHINTPSDNAPCTVTPESH